MARLSSHIIALCATSSTATNHSKTIQIILRHSLVISVKSIPAYGASSQGVPYVARRSRAVRAWLDRSVNAERCLPGDASDSGISVKRCFKNGQTMLQVTPLASLPECRRSPWEQKPSLGVPQENGAEKADSKMSYRSIL